LFLTETWLDSSIPDNILNLQNDQIFRKDRVSKKGGGVMILVNNRFPACERSLDLQNPLLSEIVCVDVVLGGMKYCFMTVYRRPGYSVNHSIDCNYLKNYITGHLRSRDNQVLVGDFNVPHIDWSSLTCPSDGVHDVMLDCFLDASLTQLLVSPTRLNSVLDLVLVSGGVEVYDLSNLPPLGAGVHDIVSFKLIYSDNCVSYRIVLNDKVPRGIKWDPHQLLERQFTKIM